ncbi:hypothetical protein GXB85_16805 [Cellulomonas sp. APG4]|uniref:hypothetical protein n=1 Tax=Cellulomonas sp. APG4 TaxID=1538656 RepID=UPI0013795F40|nr:hypothetical protein [Cellulomonas sp. APG4]NCT92596.1 hypothetical protein [Cellulomonas sp. APG4]
MRGRRWLWVVLALVVVAGIALLLWSSNRGGSPAAEPSPSGTPAATESPEPEPEPVAVPVPAPSAAPEEVAVEAEATELTLPFVTADARLRQDPDQPLLLEDVATGTALGDLEAGAREMAEEGLVQTGEPEVVSATVTASEPDADPPTLTVLACLDYSGVDVVDTDGTSVVDPTASRRSATILHLVEVDGRWLVERRTFPDDPTC